MKHEAAALAAALGAGHAPATSSVEQRVAAYAAAAQRMLASGDPTLIAIGGALLAWFEQGGDLIKYLRLKTPRGSQRNIRAIYRSSQMKTSRSIKE